MAQIGKTPPSPSQPRVIVSSTCDLETAAAENRFYPGLYYYLNAVRIDVRPLRHRQDDILALAESITWPRPSPNIVHLATNFPGISLGKPASLFSTRLARQCPATGRGGRPCRPRSPKVRR